MCYHATFSKVILIVNLQIIKFTNFQLIVVDCIFKTKVAAPVFYVVI